MTKVMRSGLQRVGPFVAGLLAAAAPAFAQPVRVVLSADSRPYQEAWEGFRAEMPDGASMSVAGSNEAAEGTARVVVAFGAKAALQRYRGAERVIEAISAARSGAVAVSMAPHPADLVERLKALQPGLKRLGFVWRSDFYGASYLPMLRREAKRLGVEIVAEPAVEDEDLPDLLRGLYGRVDAAWLPPDPLLISEKNFLIFRDFFLANGLPLYVPTSGLVERGGAASVGVSFRAIGREAARAARKALESGEPDALIFPRPPETVVSRGAAAKAGLRIDEKILKTTDKVLP